jgi:hypothetical protein
LTTQLPFGLTREWLSLHICEENKRGAQRSNYYKK